MNAAGGRPGDQSISVDRALREILDAVRPIRVEPVRYADALGRVLAEAVMAGELVPPFNNSAMDGFAVRSVYVAGASAARPVVLPVQGAVMAGNAPIDALAPGTAWRIMIGAMLPVGADTVIRSGDTSECRSPGSRQHSV